MAEQTGLSYMRFAVSVAATIAILVAARDVLQPLLIALAVWFLLKIAAAGTARQLQRVGVVSPRVAQVLSTAVMLLVFLWIGGLASQSATQIADRLPQYQERLKTLATGIEDRTGIAVLDRLTAAINEVDFAGAALGLAGSALNAFTLSVLVVIYIVFVGAEARVFERKLAALFTEPARRETALRISGQITEEIETYIGVKMVLGALQAVPTFLLLTVLGVDAPVFWALIVFFTSFIPTVGTLIGIIFPTLMALIQFDSLVPFATVLAVLLPLQLLCSNFLEPKMFSTSLDLSPLVVMIGIFAGAAIWGIVGALIVVPLLAIATIVFARIPSMRPLAILISGQGTLHVDEEGRQG
ncbi:MAG: AI-2E family transporter [Pseudomonadota bacterium]